MKSMYPLQPCMLREIAAAHWFTEKDAVRPCVLHCFPCSVLQCFPLAVFSHHQRATIGHNIPKYAKIGHKGLNKQKTKTTKKTKNKNKKTKKKQRFLETVGIGGMSLVFFLFCLFFVFQAPREGCRELSLFMPQGKDAESWVLSFVFLLASQCICQNRECVKRSAKAHSHSPLFWERGTVRVRFFHWCCIKISYIRQRCCCKISSIWDIYICIPQKCHPAGSQETKHIAHAQRETK